MKNLLEILVKDDIQEIFKLFHSILGIRILFFPALGREVLGGSAGCDTIFCKLIESRLYGKEKCLVINETKRKECLAQNRVINYQCHAGLEEVVAPVYVDYQLAGVAVTGQFRSQEVLDEKVREDWRKKFNSSELEEAFFKLPYFKPEKIQDVIRLFSILIDYIISHKIISVNGNMALWKIVSYITENISSKITLPEVAEFVDKSESTVSHLFTKTLGKTFKQVLIELKLNKAEELLLQIPNITIQEVSERVGFSDQFYFSRLYKKYRNMSPSNFRRHSSDSEGRDMDLFHEYIYSNTEIRKLPPFSM